MTPTTFFRLLKTPIDDKGEALAAQIAALNATGRADDTFTLDTAALRQIPGSPFAYWVGRAIRHIFHGFPPLESGNRVARIGDHPGDKDRYVRLAWEPEVRSTEHARQWLPYQKGGRYSRYYDDMHLVVDWDVDRQTYYGFFGRPGRSAERPSNYQYFLRPGISWPLRTGNFSPRILPKGCITSNKGPTVWVEKDLSNELLVILAVMNSAAFETLVRVQLARTELAQSYEVGLVQRTAVPSLTDDQSRSTLAGLAHQAHDLQRQRDLSDETTHAFTLPGLVEKRHTGTLLAAGLALDAEEQARQQRLAAIQAEIDDLVFDLYGLDENDRAAIRAEIEISHRDTEDTEKSPDDLSALSASVANHRAETGISHRDTENTEQFPDDLSALSASVANDVVNDEDDEEPAPPEDLPLRVQNLLMWCVGVAFGRWDIRLALDPSLLPALPGPFDPLPRCAPDALVATDGLPARRDHIAGDAWLRAREKLSHRGTESTEKDMADLRALRASVASDFPFPIAWDGILVDDENHPADLVSRVEQVIRLLWGERSDAILQEAAAILGVPDLRSYFRDPRKGFYAFHIRRYTKSRRKAPIYWLLQSEKRGYGIWLYYHRLGELTLLEAARKPYADSKVLLEEARLQELRQNLDALDGAARKRREREIERQQKLVDEVTTFRNTLEQVALRQLPPDPNDGVLISIAPLHALTPWTEAHKMWTQLLAGDYAWSTMAQQMRRRGLVKGKD